MPVQREGVGASVALRPLLLKDSNDLFEGLRQGDLQAAVPGSDQVRSATDAAGMVAGLMERGRDGSELHFSVCLNGDGRAIGMCALYDFKEDQSARIGYWVGREYRRRGYGKEAVGLLAEIAFSELGLKKIVAVSERSNSASLNLLRSLGFKEIPQDTAIGDGEIVLSLSRS